MTLAIILLLLFFLFALLMYAGKLPALLALPIMAVGIAACARVPLNEILTDILSIGAMRLSAAIGVVFFGAILGELINQSGIAETIVRKVAELSGDRPFVLAAILTLIIALLFTTLGGLGAVIMVATILLPILLSIGIPPVITGGLFLMGLSLGGILNLVNWQLYMSILGLSQSEILQFALPFAGLMFLATLLFFVIEIKRSGFYAHCSIWDESNRKPEAPPLSLLTPIMPILLVLGFSLYNLLAKPSAPFEFPIIAAMIVGILYGLLTTRPITQNTTQLATKSIIEGMKNVIPAIALIIGIGMLLTAVTHPNVSNAVAPLIGQIVPKSPWQYVLVFTLLAPLALYRGPLNIWGMGSGLVAILLATHTLSPLAIMAALMAVGQIQGVCDPTNTHNIWIANFLNVHVQDLLKRTILYMWGLAFLGLLLASSFLPI